MTSSASKFCNKISRSHTHTHTYIYIYKCVCVCVWMKTIFQYKFFQIIYIYISWNHLANEFFIRFGINIFRISSCWPTGLFAHLDACVYHILFQTGWLSFLLNPNCTILFTLWSICFLFSFLFCFFPNYWFYIFFNSFYDGEICLSVKVVTIWADDVLLIWDCCIP